MKRTLSGLAIGLRPARRTVFLCEPWEAWAVGLVGLIRPAAAMLISSHPSVNNANIMLMVIMRALQWLPACQSARHRWMYICQHGLLTPEEQKDSQRKVKENSAFLSFDNL